MGGGGRGRHGVPGQGGGVKRGLLGTATPSTGRSDQEAEPSSAAWVWTVSSPPLRTVGLLRACAGEAGHGNRSPHRPTSRLPRWVPAHTPTHTHTPTRRARRKVHVHLAEMASLAKCPSPWRCWAWRDSSRLPAQHGDLHPRKGHRAVHRRKPVQAAVNARRPLGGDSAGEGGALGRAREAACP